MSFLADWKEPWQNRVFKLINKLLLFQYSGDFLGPQESSYFDTCIQYKVDHALYHELQNASKPSFQTH